MSEQQPHHADEFAPTPAEQAAEPAARRESSGMVKNVVIALLGLAVVVLLVVLWVLIARNQTPSAPSEQATQAAASPHSSAAPNAAEGPNAAAPSATVGSGEQPTAAASQPASGASAAESRDEFLLNLPRRDAKDPFALGKVDAPLVLTLWSDFNCGYCYKVKHDMLPGIKNKVEDGTLRVEYRLMPVLGEPSGVAAKAAWAAAQQNKFWQYHDELFEALHAQPGQTQEQFFVDIARRVGVPDIAAFTKDFHSEQATAAIQSAMVEGTKLGIQATPTMLVGTKVVSGFIPAEQMQAHIKELSGRR